MSVAIESPRSTKMNLMAPSVVRLKNLRTIKATPQTLKIPFEMTPVLTHDNAKKYNDYGSVVSNVSTSQNVRVDSIKENELSSNTKNILVHDLHTTNQAFDDKSKQAAAVALKNILCSQSQVFAPDNSSKLKNILTVHDSNVNNMNISEASPAMTSQGAILSLKRILMNNNSPQSPEGDDAAKALAIQKQQLMIQSLPIISVLKLQSNGGLLTPSSSVAVTPNNNQASPAKNSVKNSTNLTSSPDQQVGKKKKKNVSPPHRVASIPSPENVVYNKNNTTPPKKSNKSSNDQDRQVASHAFASSAFAATPDPKYVPLPDFEEPLAAFFLS